MHASLVELFQETRGTLPGFSIKTNRQVLKKEKKKSLDLDASLCGDAIGGINSAGPV